MKKRMKLLLIILALSSCSFLLSSPPPRLQDRTLLISKDGPWLEYPYFKTVCEHPKRPIFKGCRQERVVEKFDLREAETRMKLINMGFFAQSKLRFVY